MNIVDIAAGSDDFNLLVRALTDAELVTTVRDASDITVFAPTDAAFTQLAVDLGFDGDTTDEDAVYNAIFAALTELATDGNPSPLLVDILLYHVAPGARIQDTIEGSSGIATLLNGAEIGVSGGELVDAEPDLDNPQIVVPDVQADNGIIQGIDAVLLPLDIPGNTPPAPNIVEIAAGSDDFNILVTALQTAGLVETVQNATDITVFAPTDAAFVKLAQDLGYTGDTTDETAVFNAIAGALASLDDDGDPIPLLTDILLYHVSAGVQTQSDVVNGGSIATLLTDATISTEAGALGDGEPDLADPNIIVPDVTASNGIIQGIDAVLLPIDVPGNTSITDLVVRSAQGFDEENSEFDMLLAAVQAAGLGETLDTAGADLTVFAPTDAAFVGLANALGYDGSSEEEAFSFLVKALSLLSNGGDPIPLLTSILQFHVSPGAKDATAVLGSTSIQTLLDDAFINVSGTTLKDGDPDIPDPQIIDTDIATSNGIVHVLDGVLIPVDVLGSDGSNDVDFEITDDTAQNLNLGADNDFALTGAGDDSAEGGQGNDVLALGAGTDTAVFSNAFDNYAIKIDGSTVTVTDRGDIADQSTGTDTLTDVELLRFSDNAAFNAEGAINLATLQGGASLTSAQFESLVELYVAYYDRAPDATGLLFWANAVANGTTMREIANLFSDQDETRDKLPADGDSGAIVDVAYAHVLERAPDDAGRAFWVSVLDSGDVTRGEFILELIAGARASTGSPDDVQTIEQKTDIGVSYALINGLTNVTNAETVLSTYDRDDAEATLAAAQSQIENFAELASGAADGPEAQITIVGAIDDPFAA